MTNQAVQRGAGLRAFVPFAQDAGRRAPTVSRHYVLDCAALDVGREHQYASHPERIQRLHLRHARVLWIESGGIHQHQALISEPLQYRRVFAGVFDDMQLNAQQLGINTQLRGGADAVSIGTDQRDMVCAI